MRVGYYGTVRRLVVVLVVAALASFSQPAAAAATNVAPPTITPITADFRQPDFATYYTVDVTPNPNRPTRSVLWRLIPPEDEQYCTNFRRSASNQEAAVWNHGDEDGCDHELMGPRGHDGIVEVYVFDGVFGCRVKYLGSVSGTGNAVECENLALYRAMGRVRDALESASIAIRVMKDGRDAANVVKRAIKQLDVAKKNAIKGGSGGDVTGSIEDAIAKDTAALKQPRATAIQTLEAAGDSKRRAIRLLEAHRRAQ